MNIEAKTDILGIGLPEVMMKFAGIIDHFRRVIVNAKFHSHFAQTFAECGQRLRLRLQFLAGFFAADGIRIAIDDAETGLVTNARRREEFFHHRLPSAGFM
jgi:hypothetical protein